MKFILAFALTIAAYSNSNAATIITAPRPPFGCSGGLCIDPPYHPPVGYPKPVLPKPILPTPR